MTIETESVTDLNAVWDPDTARMARVHASNGRIEIVLCDSDPQWVERALEIAHARPLAIVIAGPDPHAAPHPDPPTTR